MDLDELEKLARAATPGPWTYHDRFGWVTTKDAMDIFDGRYAVKGAGPYIAAANPDTVLALIAVAKAVKGERVAHYQTCIYANCYICRKKDDVQFALDDLAKLEG